MIDLILGVIADIAAEIVDIWVNKVVAKFKRKK